jgi:signal transduction histidine kinase
MAVPSDPEDRLGPADWIQSALASIGAATIVLKHAAARRVHVVLHRSARQVVAMVEDNGRGFDAETLAGPERRLGLLGMRERVALVGGSLAVESSPGQGTTVLVQVPLRDGSEEGRGG